MSTAEQQKIKMGLGQRGIKITDYWKKTIDELDPKGIEIFKNKMKSMTKEEIKKQLEEEEEKNTKILHMTGYEPRPEQGPKIENKKDKEARQNRERVERHRNKVQEVETKIALTPKQREKLEQEKKKTGKSIKKIVQNLVDKYL